MPRIPPDKIVQHKTEKRATQITRGIKQGVIRSTVDQVLEQVSAPLAEKLAPHVSRLPGGEHIPDGALRSVLDFALLNALAEVLEFGGPALSKAPGVKMDREEAQAKCQALSLWIRNYSGEKFGEQIVETAAALIPLFKDMLSTTDLTELLDAVDDELVEEEVVSHQEEEVHVTQPAFVGANAEGGY